MNETKVSVIILSYNTQKLLEQCLESVVRCLVIGDSGKGDKFTITQPLAPSTEIIVVDNGSTDGSLKVIKSIKSKAESKGFRFTLIKNKENLGFARGNNQAAKVAIGGYLFFLNSDTIVKNDAISKLVSYLDEHQEITAVSPLLLNEDCSIQKDPCYLKFPSPLFVFIYYNRILKFIANNLLPGLIYSTQNFSTPNEVAQLPGAALMIRKKVFEKIGGFEENFPHFFEDVDLSYRLRQAGRKLFLVPESKIVHFGRKSLETKVKKEGIESLYYLNFKALFRFCQENLSLLSTITIMVLVYIHLLLEMRLSLIKKLVLNQSE